MAKPTDQQIISIMERFGGSFVKRLARAAHYADSENLNRIKQTWPDYWSKYSEMAENAHESEFGINPWHDEHGP